MGKSGQDLHCAGQLAHRLFICTLVHIFIIYWPTACSYVHYFYHFICSIGYPKLFLCRHYSFILTRLILLFCPLLSKKKKYTWLAFNLHAPPVTHPLVTLSSSHTFLFSHLDFCYLSCSRTKKFSDRLFLSWILKPPASLGRNNNSPKEKPQDLCQRRVGVTWNECLNNLDTLTYPTDDCLNI